MSHKLLTLALLLALWLTGPWPAAAQLSVLFNGRQVSLARVVLATRPPNSTDTCRVGDLWMDLSVNPKDSYLAVGCDIGASAWESLQTGPQITDDTGAPVNHDAFFANLVLKKTSIPDYQDCLYGIRFIEYTDPDDAVFVYTCPTFGAVPRRIDAEGDAFIRIIPDTGNDITPTKATDLFVQAPVGSAFACNGNNTTKTLQCDVSTFTGDVGAGGTKGLVPAPGVGDAAANKFLKANGAWTAISAANDGIILFGISGSASCSAPGDNIYISPAGNGSTINTLLRVPIPRSMTIVAMYVNTGANVPASETYSSTVQKNGADQSMTCSIAAGNSTCNTSSNPVSFAAGDTLQIRGNCSGGTTAVGQPKYGLSVTFP